MAAFDLYLTQAALDQKTLFDPVTQTARYVEVMEAKGQELPAALHKFLSLEIYIGRADNAGHRAFCHENYDFPAFSDVAAEAARAARLDEHAALIDEVGAFMTSDLVTQAGAAARDVSQHKDLGLADPLRGFDRRLYGITLTKDEMDARISDYSDVARSWVLDRYTEDTPNAYYGLVSGWLLNAGTLHVVSEEERADMLHIPPKPPAPEPAKPKGWLSRLLGG